MICLCQVIKNGTRRSGASMCMQKRHSRAFDLHDGKNLGWLNDTLSHVCMHEIYPVSVLPILQIKTCGGEDATFDVFTVLKAISLANPNFIV